MQPFMFEELLEFTRHWASLGLTDDDLIALKDRLAANPNEGNVIPGSGGYRKLRIKRPGHGKRGGARVIYIVFRLRQVIELTNVYAKNQ